MKKRYSAVDLTDLAIGVLILGIVVVIGARLLVTYRDARLTDLPTGTVINETTNTVMNYSQGVTLDTAWVTSVDACYNASGGAADGPINAANYTTSISDSNGLVTITPVAGLPTSYNNTLWNCTYSIYHVDDVQWSLPDDASIGIAEYGNWFDIIVIVGIAGLILSIIFLAFGRRGEEGVSY